MIAARTFLLRWRPLFWREHHRHVAALEPSLGFDLAEAIHLGNDGVEQTGAEFGVGHLSATELQRHLDLVAVGEEFLHVPDLGVEVALADLGTQLHFLDRHVDGFLARLLGLLGLFVTELAVIHDPANGWIRQWGDFDEVEIQCPGHGQCFGQGLDSDLAAVGANQAYLTGTNAFVVPGLVLLRRCYG